MNRDECIKAIKAALKRRSGRIWSVTGGRGTAYGWITIDVPPSERTWHWVRCPGDADEYMEKNAPGVQGGHMGPKDRELLARLLGLEVVHRQGARIPDRLEFYQEYADRAEGRSPSILGKQYWD